MAPRGFADHRPLPEPPVGYAPTRQTWERRRRRADPLKTSAGKLNFGLSPALFAAAERLRRGFEAAERAQAVPCLDPGRVGGGRGAGRLPPQGVWVGYDGAMARWAGACSTRITWLRAGAELREVSLLLVTSLVVVYGFSGRELERALPGWRREWTGPALRWALADFAARTEGR